VLISRVRRTALAGAGVLAVSAAATPIAFIPSALAAAPTATEITGFTVSADTVTYGTQLTISGFLVEAGGTSAGIGGEQVSIDEYQGGPGAIATPATSSSGYFTATVTLHNGGELRALFNGDTANGYGASESSVLSVYSAQPQPVPSVTLNPQPKSTVAAGASLTFTGKATVTQDGTTYALADVPVGLVGDVGNSAVGQADTDSDGNFSVTVPANDGPDWQAEVLAQYGSPWDFYNITNNESNTVDVNVTYKTRVLSFTVPAKVAQQSSASVTGVVQEWDGTAWTAADAPVVYGYYRILPSGKWIRGFTDFAINGRFRGPEVNASLGHLRWKIVVPEQDDAGEIFAASSSGTHDSWIVSRTYEDAFSTYREPTYTNILGFITTEPSNQANIFYGQPVPGIVKFYYHPRGTTKWTYLGETRVNSLGEAGWSIGKTSGYFEIVYPAQGNYLASSKEVKI
jgi:hypothetical protein